ncbi:MAG: metallopeptidase TldD-related protein [Burkholderiaceae bacterium]
MADALPALTRDGERLTLELAAEDSTFARFNHARVRQFSQVDQCRLELTLADAHRQTGFGLTAPRNGAQALAAVRAALPAMRERLKALPDDPFLGAAAPVARSSRDDGESAGHDAADVAARIAELAAGLDFVAFLATGPVVRAVADSRGMRHWHRVQASNLDLSLHAARAEGPPAAVKAIVADRCWDEAAFVAALAQAREHLAVCMGEPGAVTPGRHRVYLGPMAVADLLGAMAWSGFSRRDRDTGTSSLSRLVDEELTLSPRFSLAESPARGLAPAFASDGHLRPAELPLIESGRAGAVLVSPRSAAEFGEPVNADGAEWPGSLMMSAGELPWDERLSALGDGLWIENLWYLNYSDRRAARVTGMSRFASFIVAGGKPVAPLAPMRFDDTLLHVFGDAFEAATRDTWLLPDGSTWGARSLNATRCPGLLVSDMRFTL